MIEVKHVRKSFGEKVVLDDVSLVMQPGKTNIGFALASPGGGS